VGDRLRDLGYEVRLTPLQGDHGADLLITQEGETAVVQCKHRPDGTVGEPVLRDLYGTMHHFGATRALLVTTGYLSPAARSWVQGKPLTAWDAADLQARWAAAIAQTTAQLAAAVPPVSPAGAGDGGRSGWYVYTDDGGQRYALKLPRSIGDHPALGFLPLADPELPIAPAVVTLRLAIFSRMGARPAARKHEFRTVPIGTRQAMDELRHTLHAIDLPQRDGTLATWRFHRSTSETYQASRKRARAMGGAPPPRWRYRDPEAEPA
jgi:hypothetical protein